MRELYFDIRPDLSSLATCLSELFLARRCPRKWSRVSFMKVAWPIGSLFLFLVSSFTYGQKPPETTGPSGSQPLEIRLTKPPSWKDNCLEVSIKRVNRSKSRISLLPSTPFEGVEIYSSVTDATNTLGQGVGEAWMLVYGQSDVFDPHAKSLPPGTEKQNTYCVGETFEVKETGKEEFRQVRLQGKLRMYAGYGQKAAVRKMNKQKQEKMTRTYLWKGNDSEGWTFGEVMLEIPIPCPNLAADGDCTTPPAIFSGEHDVWTIEMEPPPRIEVRPPSLPTFAINPPPPPKP